MWFAWLRRWWCCVYILLLRISVCALNILNLEHSRAHWEIWDSRPNLVDRICLLGAFYNATLASIYNLTEDAAQATTTPGHESFSMAAICYPVMHLVWMYGASVCILPERSCCYFWYFFFGYGVHVIACVFEIHGFYDGNLFFLVFLLSISYVCGVQFGLKYTYKTKLEIYSIKLTYIKVSAFQKD